MNYDVVKDSVEQRSFMVRVYAWMFVALCFTGLVAAFTAATPSLVEFILFNKLVFYGLLIGEVLLVVYLSGAIEAMSSTQATVVFLTYSVVNGLTFSIIFLVFTSASIASTFYITAGTFGVMSLYGYFTDRDLTGLGDFCLMGLIGLIIASIVNIFFFNETVYWVTTYIGVLVFVGLTAYDVQKIKTANILGNEGTEEDAKEAIMGALTLYLDFVNLFLYLLRIFGKRK